MVNEKDLECNVCKESFSSLDKLNLHRKIHTIKIGKNKAKNKISKSQIFVIGISAIALIVIGLYFSQSSSSTITVQSVKCDPIEGAIFHIHAHLDLYVDGKWVTIPSGVGIKPNECLYWLHTHNTSGVIHIESPEQTPFTLGQFIQVWDITSFNFPKFEELTHGDKNLKAFVNGAEIKENFENIKISAHDEIVLVSGSIPEPIPSSYNFDGL